jgi:hypothetical protein
MDTGISKLYDAYVPALGKIRYGVLGMFSVEKYTGCTLRVHLRGCFIRFLRGYILPGLFNRFRTGASKTRRDEE